MQKTAYERRISDWSSDVCSSDLHAAGRLAEDQDPGREGQPSGKGDLLLVAAGQRPQIDVDARRPDAERVDMPPGAASDRKSVVWRKSVAVRVDLGGRRLTKKKNPSKL